MQRCIEPSGTNSPCGISLSFNDLVRLFRVSSPDPPGASWSTRGLHWFPLPEEIVSAVLERGSYPFPFRTRKSSLPSPMVPGPRARESRAPLDSRGPSPERRGASSFLQTAPPTVSLPPKGGHAHVSAEALSGQRSPPRPVSTGRCGSRPPEGKPSGGLFFYPLPGRTAEIADRCYCASRLRVLFFCYVQLKKNSFVRTSFFCSVLRNTCFLGIGNH